MLPSAASITNHVTLRNETVEKRKKNIRLDYLFKPHLKCYCTIIKNNPRFTEKNISTQHLKQSPLFSAFLSLLFCCFNV